MSHSNTGTLLQYRYTDTIKYESIINRTKIGKPCQYNREVNHTHTHTHARECVSVYSQKLGQASKRRSM